MNNNAISGYLSSLDMTDDYKCTAVSCEICGDEQHSTVLESVVGPGDKPVNLPVLGCEGCGHVYQKYVFEASFYQDYYNKFYRLNLFGQSAPDKQFFMDQVRRGNFLFKSLQPWLTKAGKLVDVGCSAGGLMIPFAKNGWSVQGNDPDLAYVEYGKKIGLDIEPISAEQMTPENSQADLIIINGSLEHVYDVNEVMQKCRQMVNPGGHLLIEGRALGYGIQLGFLTHNHRRYLSSHAIELLMLKHGWQPVHSTDDPICGPSRPGATFVLAKAVDVVDEDEITQVSKLGHRLFKSTVQPQLKAMSIHS
jgi:SAM-dependent methyltransferase